MAYKLSVVLGYRDRDVERVERSLASLAAQCFHDFEVLLVDYGSQPATSRAVQHVVDQYDVCRYVFTDTRGWPWNRAQALNIAGRRAESDYIITTDVDMIYPPDFLEVFAAHADPGKELHIFPHLLPKNFADWDNVIHYRNRLPTMNRNAKGIQCIATEVYHHVRGYDEFYRFYGTEDRDIHQRLNKLGLEEVWVNDDTCLFHQWHPRNDYVTAQFMPEGYWSRALNHLLGQQDQLIRNDETWGSIYAAIQRPAFQFLDLESMQLKEQSALHHFDAPPNSNQSLAQLASQFRDLPSGHAFAVHHAFYPVRNPWADRLIRYGNRLLSRANTPIDYSINRLHGFVVELIDLNPQLVADYFLGFPALDGISLLVRR